MKFEWDKHKNHINIAKHGIDFSEAIKIFDNFTLNFIDDRFEYDEMREISIGMIGL